LYEHAIVAGIPNLGGVEGIDRCDDGGLSRNGTILKSTSSDMRQMILCARASAVPPPKTNVNGAAGRLDAAFNNAGINCDGAPWNCMKAELRQMIAQGSGAIVNCSSIGGMRGSKGRSAYSASKFGVIGLTRAAALDYAATGIRINAVCPGIIGDTPMAVRVTKNNNPDIIKAFIAAEPIGRLGKPEEIAAAVLWLCSPAASFMVGHAMAVDGGILA
jgi:Enoyl-(Acyl carrier protein) reductase